MMSFWKYRLERLINYIRFKRHSKIGKEIETFPNSSPLFLQEQLNNVLDAMFERKTTADEHVITQGDDGDNFYVIDRGIFDIYVNGNKVCPKLSDFIIFLTTKNCLSLI